jgi:hypothetical protein
LQAAALLAVSIFAMSGTVCLDVFEQMAVESAKQVGWMLDGSPCCVYKFLGDSRSHVAGLVDRKPIDDSEDFRTGVMADEVDPGSLLTCYRFADFIFAISARARSASSA